MKTSLRLLLLAMAAGGLVLLAPSGPFPSFATANTGVINARDFGDQLGSGNAHFWRGYAFKVSTPTTMTHIVGGPDDAHTGVFEGALFEGVQDGSSFRTGALLRHAIFPTTTAVGDDRGRVSVPVDHIVLAPDTWYIIAQGRTSGNTLHFYVATLNVPDLIAASFRISDWQPQNNNAFVIGTNQSAADTANRPVSTTPNKVAVGFRFLTNATLPAIETLDTPLTGELTDGGGAPTALYMEYSANSDMSDLTVVLDQIGYEGAVPYAYSSSLSGLPPATTYYYRARAINDAGSVTGEIRSFTTPAAPGAPTISSVTPGDSNLTIAFTIEADVTNVEYSLNNGANWIARSPASAASPLTVSDLQNGTSYPIRLRAVRDGVIGAQSDSVSGVPMAPATLTTSTPTAVTSTSATLGGSISADGGSAVSVRGIVITSDATAALVTGSDDPEVRTVAIGSGSGGFSASVAELEAGTTYRFRAYATNGAGTAYGTTETFETPPAIIWRSGEPLVVGDDDYASALATIALGPILDEDFTLPLEPLTAGGGGGALAFEIVTGTLPAGLTLSAGSITGTVTSSELVGATADVTFKVTEAVSGTSATRTIAFTVATYGVLRTTDYGTAPVSGGAYCWRGYYFRTGSEATVVTGLIGGGTSAYVEGSREFRGALYAVNLNASGAPTTLSSILADVRFAGSTVNQLVRLEEPVLLAPDTWYALMQGSVSGIVLHHYVQSLDAGDLVAASSRISDWLPGDAAPGRAYFGPCDAAPSALLNRSFTITSDKPAVGLEFLTTSKPPLVTTEGVVAGRMTGALSNSSANAVGYIQHGANLDSGSTLTLAGARTAGESFDVPLSDVSNVTSSSYSFRARAINDAGASVGATVTLATFAQTLTGWTLPASVSSGAVYGDEPFTIAGITTSASGSPQETVTVNSETMDVCTVSSTTGGSARDVTVTIVGSGTCTVRATHPGGWDPVEERLYRSVQASLSVTVAKRPIGITGTFSPQERAYDGTTVGALSMDALVPDPALTVGADALTLTGVTIAFDGADAGERAASITGATLSGVRATHYTLSLVGAPTASGRIIPRPLTVDTGGFVASDKVYDSTDGATITSSTLTLTGLATGDTLDDITWTPSARFTVLTAGTGRSVELVGGAVLGGPKGANYVLDVTGAPTTTADITRRPVTVVGASAGARPYDSTAGVTVSGATLANAVAGDAVSLANATSGTAASPAAGTHGVSTAMTLVGTAAANYELLGQPSLSVTITPLTVDVTMSPLPARAYDGTTAIALAPAAFRVAGVLPGESIAVSGTAQLSSRAAGTRTVTLAAPTFTPGPGTSLANYVLPSAVTGTVTVTPVPLRVAGATVAQRPWDGTTAATVSGARLEGVRAGDNVSLTGATSGSFASAQPGTHVVRFTPTLVGVDAGNYTLSVPEVTGTIVPAAATLRITGGLVQFADGSPRTVRAAVSPASAGRVVVTYPSGGAPSAPGSYAVSVTLQSSTHAAAAVSATLTIEPVEALVLPRTGGTAPGTTAPGTTPGSTAPEVDERRREAMLARIAVRTDGTLALPEIGPVLEEDGTAPTFAPREHRVLEDGQPSEARVVVVEDQRVRVETDDDSFSIELQAAVATQEGRVPLPVDADGTLLLDRGGFVEVGGSGFLPGSTAEVWMFSEATFLGTAVVDADGSFGGAFPVDEFLAAGEHTLQLNGIGRDERVRSTSLGVRIDDPEDPSRDRVVVASAGDTTSGGLMSPLWLALLAAVLGAAVTRWWVLGRRRRDEDGAQPSHRAGAGTA